MQIKHLCFTYFVVPVEAHLFKEPATRKKQQRWLKEALFTNKTFSTSAGVEYAVRLQRRKQLRIDDHAEIIYGKLCKKKHIHRHEITADDIQESNIDDWPYVGFVCDMRKGNQKLIVEFDNRVIDRISTFKNNLQDIANQQLFHHGYSVAFELIVKKEAFWKLIKSAQGVYKLHLSLNSPNLFGASDRAGQALRELQEVLNNNRTEVEFINDDGHLKVPEEKIRTYQEYADKGGGWWKIVVQKNNRKARYNSSEKALIVTVEASEKASPDMLKLVLDKVLASVNEDKD